MGVLTLFGIHPEVVKQSSASGALQRVAMQGALFHTEFLGLVLDVFTTLLKARVAATITPRNDVSELGKACARTFLYNTFSQKFEQITLGMTLASLTAKNRRVVRAHTQEAIIEETVRYCDHVLRKDYSVFGSAVPPAAIRHMEGLFGKYRHPEEARRDLEHDFGVLDPLLREISDELGRLLPRSPTVVFTDTTFFDDTDRLKKILDALLEKGLPERKQA